MAHQQCEAEGQHFFPMKSIPGLAWSLTYRRYWLNKRQMSTFVVRLCAKAHQHTRRGARRDSGGRENPNNTQACDGGHQPITGLFSQAQRSTGAQWQAGTRISQCQQLGGLGSRGSYWADQVSEPGCWGGSTLYIYICIYMCVCMHI